MPNAATFQVGSLGELSSRVIRWAREPLDPDTVTDAINDAIESLWQAVSLATLSRFLSRPVGQMVLANTIHLDVVSVANPTIYLVTAVTPGGALPARVKSFTYSYATDSGSETAACPSIVAAAGAGQLFVAQPPAPVFEVIGWNLYTGDAGRLCKQNVAPIPFNVSWIEGPFGMVSAPDGPFAPLQNNTADNIASVVRLDATNQLNTKTPWQQSDMSSSVISAMQARLPTNSTFVRRAYDLVNNNVIEIRPAGQLDIPIEIIYVVRPRRLRYANSRIPFTSFPSQKFLASAALSDIMGGLGEMEMAQMWSQKAKDEEMKIVLSVANENWDKNTRVKAFHAGRGSGYV